MRIFHLLIFLFFVCSFSNVFTMVVHINLENSSLSSWANSIKKILQLKKMITFITTEHWPRKISFLHPIPSNFTSLPLERVRRELSEGEHVVEDFEFITFLMLLLHHPLTPIYAFSTLAILATSLLGSFMHILCTRSVQLFEEEGEKMNKFTGGFRAYLRLRFGVCTREFFTTRPDLMIELVHQDKRRSHFTLPSHIILSAKSIPSYSMPDQKSVQVQLRFRRNEPFPIPLYVRLRLENGSALVGMYIYAVDLYMPNMGSTLTYVVHSPLYGGNKERPDSIFKFSLMLRNTGWSPTEGLTYFETGLFCYFFVCTCYLFPILIPGAKNTNQIQIFDIAKFAALGSFGSALFTGLLMAIYTYLIRGNYVLSQGALSWSITRVIYLCLCCFCSNVLGFYGIFSLYKMGTIHLHSYVQLFGGSIASLPIWILISYTCMCKSQEEQRYLRTRAQESIQLHAKETFATKARKVPVPVLATHRPETKEISFKQLVAKQLTGKDNLYALEAAAVTHEEQPRTIPKPNLGHDYYEMPIAKGKVTSISQYFQGVPRLDNEGKNESNKQATPELAKPIPLSTKPKDGRTMSSSSVVSTGSDYYAAMVKEGKIPKIGSISQYGALLK